MGVDYNRRGVRSEPQGRKIKISDYKALLNKVKLENEEKIRKMEGVRRLLAPLFSKENVRLTEKNERLCEKLIERYLELLSDCYSPHHFFKCLTFVHLFMIEKAIRDSGLLANNIYHYCAYPYTLEVIFNELLTCDDFEGFIDFDEVFMLIRHYYDNNVVACCDTEDGSCAHPIYPELPVKLALKLFCVVDIQIDFKKYILEKSGVFLVSNLDELKNLYFNLLRGEKICIDHIVSRVSEAFEQMGDIRSWHDLVLLLEIIHTAAVRSLQSSPDDFERLLKCYDHFQGRLESSATVLKRYMLAKYREETGDLDEAIKIYLDLIRGDRKVPVFEQLIHCLERNTAMDRELRFELLMAFYQEAAEYYKDASIFVKQEYYEYKLNTLILESSSGRVLCAEPTETKPKQHSGIEISDDSTVLEVKEKPGLQREARKPRKTTKTITKEQAVLPLAESSCNSGKTGESLMVVGADQSGLRPDGNGGRPDAIQKDSWDYWKELNELFEDYHHLPSKKSDVEKLSAEACEAFPEDIWVLHCAAWGFHLIGDDEQATNILLKGLSRSLSADLGFKIQVKSPADISLTLQEIRKHREIIPNTKIGLNAAAYLSSLGHTLYAKGQTEYSEFCRSEADWLNPKRQFKYALRQPL